MSAVILKNCMEDFVLNGLSSRLKKLKICDCELCTLDVAAIVLNELPPKYVVTNKGEVFTKIDFLQQQFEVDLVREISKAADMVRKSPRHPHNADGTYIEGKDAF